jgi:ATP/maltotriose-dependent transcriptional regulator MalT
MRVNAAESFIWAVQTVIDADIPELKNRELGVLKLIAQGLGTNKVSERLRHGPKPFRCIESISGRD